MDARVLVLALVGMLVVVSALAAGSQTNDEVDPLPEGVIEDTIVIGFHDAIPGDVDSWVASRGGEVLIVEPTLSWISARFDSAQAASDALEDALDRVDVRWAEHDGYVSHMAVPNDPMYSSQWGFPAINAPEAWDTQLGNHDVSVAILDTGTEGDHPDLEANICGPHQSFISGEPDPLNDRHFHGTHVGGTVAAVSDNGVGVAGTSQSCLMAVKVLNAWGSGSWSGVAAGIVWASDNGADIISMSLGGGNPGMVVQEAVAHAYGVQGTLIIAAAGNSYCFGGDSVGWPAQYPAVMAVAALAAPNVRSSFSSCGPAVEITAPGSNVLSTWRGGGYGSISGTSMATPHVSGVAALVMSEHPDLNASTVRCVLALSSDDVLAPGADTESGWGRVNAERAVALDVDPVRLTDALLASNTQELSYSCTPEALNAVLSFTA